MFSVEKGNCILRACMCVYVFICIENLRERACAACVRERVRESRLLGFLECVWVCLHLCEVCSQRAFAWTVAAVWPL